MTEARLALNEAQTLRYLAEEKWKRHGNSIVSQETFTDAAARQYMEGLSQETRDTLKFRMEADRQGDAMVNAKRLILDARAAQAYFSDRITVANDDRLMNAR